MAQVEAFVALALPPDSVVPLECLVAYTRDGLLEEALRRRGARVWSFDRQPLLPDREHKPFLCAELCWLREHPYVRRKWPASFDRVVCQSGLWRFVDCTLRAAVNALVELLSPGGELTLRLERERAPSTPQVDPMPDGLWLACQAVGDERIETRIIEGLPPHTTRGPNWSLEDWQRALEQAGCAELRVDVLDATYSVLRARQKG